VREFGNLGVREFGRGAISRVFTATKAISKGTSLTIRCKNRDFLNIRAIIFDKDGTLEDSEVFSRELADKRAKLIDARIPGIGKSLLTAFGIQENRLDPTGLMAVGSRQENEIAAAAYIAKTGRSWFEALAIAKKSFNEADRSLQDKAHTSSLFTGSLEVLQCLSQRGLKLGILSADSTKNIQSFIVRHQLSEYIGMALGADVGIHKPDPALFVRACQILKVKPSETLMVGDSQGDMAMAKAARAAGAIGISWKSSQAVHLKAADVAIAQLDEIHVY
jgi:phosphoglycolate phosphatase